MKSTTKKEFVWYIYSEVSMLHDVAKMLCNTEFKSDEAKGFNAGQEFAYRNVLKLISDKVEKEMQNENRK